MPRQSTQTTDLLTNAGATGAGVGFGGGKAALAIIAGLGGATVGLEVLGPDGATWIAVSGASSATSTSQTLDLAAGTYRGTITGGTTPSGVYVRLTGVL